MTQEGIKLLGELSVSCKGNEEQIELIRRIITVEQLDKVRKAAKFDIWKAVDKRQCSFVLEGVYYHDGTMVASDGNILVVLKSDYPSEYEGKIIKKDGTTIDRRYPKYQQVIDSAKAKIVGSFIPTWDNVARAKRDISLDKKFKGAQGFPWRSVRIADSVAVSYKKALLLESFCKTYGVKSLQYNTNDNIGPGFISGLFAEADGALLYTMTYIVKEDEKAFCCGA